MPAMLIFGMGYTASYLANRLRSRGWEAVGTGREAKDGIIAFDDDAAVLAALENATHVLSSVPPVRNGAKDGVKDGIEPVLGRYGEAIKSTSLQWTGYLSSTGVYGDVHGAWVDETAPIGWGRRKDRSTADLRWQDLRDDVRVFRLPGIYGPRRSILDRLRAGTATRVDIPEQVFSRIHVMDIVSALIASFDGPPGVYNIADDLPAAQHEVIEYAAVLLGMKIPKLVSLDNANLSQPALDFYTENRRVANGKAQRLLGWKPLYPDFQSGLRALFADEG